MELASVGPFLEKIIKRWLEDPPPLPEVSELQQNFLFRSSVKRILGIHPDWLGELKGDLQMHTEWSDGSGTVAEMAAAGCQRGYEFIAITDHAKGLKIAGGINETDLQEQALEIAAVNEKYEGQVSNFRVLRSIELNMDVRGQGDLDSVTLKGLDIVLGAFHSSLRKADDQTERYIAALNYRDLHILGHPRGRIYNYRLGLKADWKKVFEKAAKLVKAVEIDCYPDRQDLDVKRLKIARRSGVKISLDTDAHHPWQLEFIEFGLAAAILAEIPKERILNFMTREKLLIWAKSHG